MNGLPIRSLGGALIIAAALTVAGCLERTEMITIADDGSATIEVQFKGDAMVLEGPQALPSAPEWAILEHRIDSSDNKPQLTLRAARTVPYGSALPESFARAESAEYNLDLRFPSEISVRKEGNRTYYEFRRTYQAMRFTAYDLTEIPMLWDAALEQRVIDSGLLNVSEQDRKAYLDQFAAAFGYRIWRMNREALANLVRDGRLEPSAMDTVAARAAVRLETSINPQYLLDLMQESDETITLTLDSLEEAGAEQFRSELLAIAGQAGTALVQRFEQEREIVKKEYRLAELTGGNEFGIELHMPGTIISTNGTLEFDEPGKVNWFFKGDKLHDADIPLYALSVVTK